MKYNVSPHRKLKTDIVQLVRLASDAAAEERDISLRSKSLLLLNGAQNGL